MSDQHILLPREPEDLAVTHGVDVGELGQFLEVWAHQDFHLTHVGLLHLEEAVGHPLSHSPTHIHNKTALERGSNSSLTSFPSTSITSLNTCRATTSAESLYSRFWLTMTRVTVETESPVSSQFAASSLLLPFSLSTGGQNTEAGHNQ